MRNFQLFLFLLLTGCAGRAQLMGYIPAVHATKWAIDPPKALPTLGSSATCMMGKYGRDHFHLPDKPEALTYGDKLRKGLTRSPAVAEPVVECRSLGRHQTHPRITHNNSFPPPEKSPHRTAGILYKTLGWIVGIGGIALGITIGSWPGVLVAIVLVVLGTFLGLLGGFINGEMP